jgi:hypothetical protein
VTLDTPGSTINADLTIQGGAYGTMDFSASEVLASKVNSESYTRRILLKFDTQNFVPANAVIHRAVLYLVLKHAQSSEPRPLTAHYVGKSFVTGQTNWLYYRPGLRWDTPGGDLGSSYGTTSVGHAKGSAYAFDLTALVQRAVNGDFGSRYTRVALVDTGGASSGSYKEFHSTRAADAAVRPRLVVTFVTSGSDGPVDRPPAPTPVTWMVNAGDDLQAAINKAQLGDTILLQAGATFAGNFTLPVKSGSSYLTIRSSAPDSALPPPDTRIDPSYAPRLPLIKGNSRGPALATEAGAHHYRLQALAFASDGWGDVVTLGDGSAAQNSLSLVPHDLVVDRVYIHGNPAGQKRGIALNSASTSIINSHIDNIRVRGYDSQAICGWNGPGPFTIVNNYLEAASENIMFGGADPAIPYLVPSDITIRHNHLFKPLSWRGAPGWVIKNLFELKNAQRLLIDGNVFENVWLDDQTGYAIAIGPRNQDGTAPWSTVQDVTFTNNVIRHAGSGIVILGTDYIHPSGRVRNVVIRNNLWEDISGKTWGGQGRWILMEDGSVNVTFDHNTVFNDGETTLLAENGATTGFVFTNNIVPDNAWAIFGNGEGNGTIATFFPSSTFRHNIITGAPAGNYPASNYYPPSMSAVGFVDLAGGNFRLSPSSPYHKAATEGGDVGADIDAINAAAGTSY